MFVKKGWRRRKLIERLLLMILCKLRRMEVINTKDDTFTKVKPVPSSKAKLRSKLGYLNASPLTLSAD